MRDTFSDAKIAAPPTTTWKWLPFSWNYVNPPIIHATKPELKD